MIILTKDVALRNKKRNCNKLPKSFELDQIAAALRFETFLNGHADVKQHDLIFLKVAVARRLSVIIFQIWFLSQRSFHLIFNPNQT